MREERQKAIKQALKRTLREAKHYRHLLKENKDYLINNCPLCMEVLKTGK